MTAYAAFLQFKQMITTTSGIEVAEECIHPGLFPFQRRLVQWALRKGRVALFADTGLGKSRMQIEWARLVTDVAGGRALILAPLAVTHQTIAEASRIGVHITYCRDQGDVPASGIAISNYERLDRFDPHAFVAVVLDESSILKAFSGVTKKALITAFADTPYRLCCTATPAPNDLEELCNHADFLGVMKPNEMRSTFFIADSRGEFMRYRLKRHARSAFFRWLSSWAMALKMPSHLGYEDGDFVLPGLQIKGEWVETDYCPPDKLFAIDVRGIGEATTVRRGTLTARVAKVAEIIAREPDEPRLIWCGLNDEGRELARLVPDAAIVEGSASVEEKTAHLLDFAEGRTRVLITKPSIAGFGMNFQVCARMAFLGLGYSYEQYYQAIRRCYRFGQRREVIAYVVLSSLERPIFEIVCQKEAEATQLSSGLLAEVVNYERAELFAGTSAADDYEPRLPILLPSWLVEGAVI
jgi:hypothetical protein